MGGSLEPSKVGIVLEQGLRRGERRQVMSDDDRTLAPEELGHGSESLVPLACRRRCERRVVDEGRRHPHAAASTASIARSATFTGLRAKRRIMNEMVMQAPTVSISEVPIAASSRST